MNPDIDVKNKIPSFHIEIIIVNVSALQFLYCTRPMNQLPDTDGKKEKKKIRSFNIERIILNMSAL